jgi:hypothetical protein
MGFSDLISRLHPGKRRAEKAKEAKEALKANAEKALRMKQESKAGAQIPPHQTPHEGMHDHSANDRDHTPAREGSFTPELKRGKVARSGDAS